MTFVKQIGGAASLGAAMLIGACLSAPSAQAAYTVTLNQVGSDVVATGSGTLDLDGLLFGGSSPIGAASMTPITGTIVTGPVAPHSVDVYGGAAGPMSFGNGSVNAASVGSGDSVGILAPRTVFVPTGYMSGAALSNTATWDDQTFASLGVTPGVYVWTWVPPGLATDDSFTLDAVAVAVPEPGSLVLLALPLGLVMLLAARLRGATRATLGGAA